MRFYDTQPLPLTPFADVLTDDELIKLIKYHKSRVVELNLRDCHLLTFAVLSVVVQHCHFLQKLDFSLSKPDSPKKPEITLKRNFRYLIYLNLENRYGLIKLILQAPFLSILILKNCQNLLHVETKSHSLKLIDMQNCAQLTDGGITRIGAPLTHLREVNLRGTAVHHQDFRIKHPYLLTLPIEGCADPFIQHLDTELQRARQDFFPGESLGSETVQLYEGLKARLEFSQTALLKAQKLSDTKIQFFPSFIDDKRIMGAYLLASITHLLPQSASNKLLALTEAKNSNVQLFSIIALVATGIHGLDQILVTLEQKKLKLQFSTFVALLIVAINQKADFPVITRLLTLLKDNKSKFQSGAVIILSNLAMRREIDSSTINEALSLSDDLSVKIKLIFLIIFATLVTRQKFEFPAIGRLLISLISTNPKAQLETSATNQSLTLPDQPDSEAQLDAALTDRLLTLLNSTDLNIKLSALIALAALATEGMIESSVVDHLLPLLDDSNLESECGLLVIIILSAAVTYQKSNPSIFDKVLSLLDNPNEDLQLPSIFILSAALIFKKPDFSMTDRLLSLLNDPDLNRRSAGLILLGILSIFQQLESSKIEQALPLLDDPNPGIQCISLIVLGTLATLQKLKSSVLIDRLSKLLANKEKFSQSAATIALGRMARHQTLETSVINQLLALLKNEDSLVAATIALGMTATHQKLEPSAINQLLTLIENEQPLTPLAAAFTLGMIAKYQSLEPSVINKLLALFKTKKPFTLAVAPVATTIVLSMIVMHQKLESSVINRLLILSKSADKEEGCFATIILGLATKHQKVTFPTIDPLAILLVNSHLEALLMFSLSIVAINLANQLFAQPFNIFKLTSIIYDNFRLLKLNPFGSYLSFEAFTIVIRDIMKKAANHSTSLEQGDSDESDKQSDKTSSFEEDDVDADKIESASDMDTDETEQSDDEYDPDLQMALELSLMESKISSSALLVQFDLQRIENFKYTAGNCLFDAVAIFTPKEDAESLRKIACTQLESDFKKDTELSKNLTASGKAGDKLNTQNGLESYSTCTQYLRLMKQDCTWGSAIEVLALARALKRPIAVIAKDYLQIFEEPDYCDNEPIFLNYINGIHYESLFPANDDKTAKEILSKIKKYNATHKKADSKPSTSKLDLFELALASKFKFNPGNCLFDALAFALASKDTGKSLRKKAIAQLKQDKQLITFDFSECSLMTDKGLKKFDTPDTYIALMSDDQTWGGMPEIIALARALKQPIAIIAKGYQIIIEEDSYCNNPPLFIHYTGNGHYQPLVVPSDNSATEILQKIRHAKKQAAKIAPLKQAGVKKLGSTITGIFSRFFTPPGGTTPHHAPTSMIEMQPLKPPSMQ